MTARLRSMTGFAEAVAEDRGCLVRVAVRSVNHRFLDVRVHLPEGLEALELSARSLVREKLRRGHVDVFVRLEGMAVPAVHVNRQVAALYLKAVKELTAEFRLLAEPDLGAILRLPGVVETGAPLDSAAAEQIGKAFQRALSEALERLDGMRGAEGQLLGEELARCLVRLEACIRKIETLAEQARPALGQRLQERIRELLGGLPIDPARVAQEAAIVAARDDTTEETARLRSHLEQFAAALGGPGEAGKKLDFLCQEMQREASTVLAKAPGLGPEGLEITRQGLEAKGEIEKLREQVQNIE
jgi:uncharacterized protein (TIGR00255 family)